MEKTNEIIVTKNNFENEKLKLEQANSPTEKIIFDSSITDKEVTNLINIVRSNATLKINSVKIDSDHITDKSIEHIMKISNLTELDIISSKHITKKSIDHINTTTSLHRLSFNFKEETINDEWMKKLGKLITNHQTIQELALINVNTHKIQGWSNFLSYLKGNQTLTRLTLNGCKISKEFFDIEDSQYLFVGSAIQMLNLSQNSIGYLPSTSNPDQFFDISSKIIAFLNSSTHESTLTELNLRNNSSGNRILCFNYIKNLLAQNKCRIKSLNLSANNLHSNFLPCLADYLSSHVVNLKNLDLCEINMITNLKNNIKNFIKKLSEMNETQLEKIPQINLFPNNEFDKQIIIDNINTANLNDNTKRKLYEIFSLELQHPSLSSNNNVKNLPSNEKLTNPPEDIRSLVEEKRSSEESKSAVQMPPSVSSTLSTNTELNKNLVSDEGFSNSSDSYSAPEKHSSEEDKLIDFSEHTDEFKTVDSKINESINEIFDIKTVSSDTTPEESEAKILAEYKNPENIKNRFQKMKEEDSEYIQSLENAIKNIQSQIDASESFMNANFIKLNADLEILKRHHLAMQSINIRLRQFFDSFTDENAQKLRTFYLSLYHELRVFYFGVSAASSEIVARQGSWKDKLVEAGNTIMVLVTSAILLGLTPVTFGAVLAAVPVVIGAVSYGTTQLSYVIREKKKQKEFKQALSIFYQDDSEMAIDMQTRILAFAVTYYYQQQILHTQDQDIPLLANIWRKNFSHVTLKNKEHEFTFSKNKNPTEVRFKLVDTQNKSEFTKCLGRDIFKKAGVAYTSIDDRGNSIIRYFIAHIDDQTHSKKSRLYTNQKYGFIHFPSEEAAEEYKSLVKLTCQKEKAKQIEGEKKVENKKHNKQLIWIELKLQSRELTENIKHVTRKLFSPVTWKDVEETQPNNTNVISPQVQKQISDKTRYDNSIVRPLERLDVQVPALKAAVKDLIELLQKYASNDQYRTELGNILTNLPKTISQEDNPPEAKSAKSPNSLAGAAGKIGFHGKSQSQSHDNSSSKKGGSGPLNDKRL